MFSWAGGGTFFLWMSPSIGGFVNENAREVGSSALTPENQQNVDSGSSVLLCTGEV